MSAPSDPNQMGKDALRNEVIRLRGTLHVIHDHLHHERADAAHEAIHCAVEGARPDAGNIALDAAARLHAFIGAFNELCRVHDVPACSIVLVPSVTVPGAVSIQMGGCVQTIQIVRQMMGKAPTHAIGGA